MSAADARFQSAKADAPMHPRRRFGIQSDLATGDARVLASKPAKGLTVRRGSLAELPGEAAVSSWDSAPAAPSPGSAATAASPAASTPAGTHTAATASAAATAASATANNNHGHLRVAAKVFPIEEMERGETDVGHFLFTEDEAQIGRGVIGLRDIGSGRRGCGCTTWQRKTQSSGAQHRQGGSCMFLLFRRLLDARHGRILQKFSQDLR
jgi:hypothetical protein